MSLGTTFTELFGVSHPIALAPMASASGGELAAAVSNGGGLGLVGGGRGDPRWLERELRIVTERTEKPWGVGFLSWSASREAVEQALEYRPHAVLVSFGDPRPLAEPVLERGVRLIVQVTDLDEANQAVALGADVVVAQGTEGGGHGGGRSTLSFVPVVVDLAAPRPVLAAGGIADGRGLAAALVLGAAGALLGTRFEATPEALVTAEIVNAILAAKGDDTERSRLLDIARGTPWPERYPGRSLRNAFLDQWHGRENELDGDEDTKAGFRQAVERGDPAVLPVWASQAVDLITQAVPAADLVGSLVAEAEVALTGAGRAIGASATPP
jgi:nitronate monooxygenase